MNALISNPAVQIARLSRPAAREDNNLNMNDLTILVVDDEPNIVEVVGAYLKREHFNVVTAADGEDALRKVSAQSPDLIVMDVMLPSLDGLEVCRRVRTMGN